MDKAASRIRLLLSISLTDKTHLINLFDKTIFNDVKGLDYPLFRGLID